MKTAQKNRIMPVNQHIVGLCLSFLFIYLPFNSYSNGNVKPSFIKKTSTVFQKKIADSLQQTLEESFPNIDFFSLAPVLSPNSATCYDLVTTCFTNGNRADTTVCSEGAVVQYGYNDRGDVLTDGDPNTRGVTSYLATVGQVGSVWGTAYNKFNNHLYVAAFIRRHSDVGASGLGAIYQIDLDNPPVDNGAPCTPITPWLDINNATCLGGGATLFPTVPTAASRGLGAKSEPSQDAWAFDKVGKEGIADIDISEDGSTMYVTDMTNQQIVVIDMASQNCSQVPITNPCGGDSEYRPFAVTENNGDVYIGITCDGTGATRDTSHHVMRFDNPANPTGTVGVATWTTKQWGPNFFDLWQDWSDDYNADYRPSEFVDGVGDIYVRRLQSVLTDIEFDADGDMVVGLTSRHNWQLGWANYPPDNTTDLIKALAYGDLQNADENGGNFTPNQANEQWTFYETADFTEFTITTEESVFIGGMVVSDCCGTEYVTAHLQDPHDFESNGVAWMNRVTGETQGNSLATGRLDLVFIGGSNPGAFGKSTALGDMEMLIPDCSLSISTAYSENCTGSGPYTADWKIGISAIEQPDNAISYQRNSEAVQTHTLTGTTDTLTFSAIPADGGAYDTIRVYFTNETTCGDTLIIKRPEPCPSQITDCSFTTGVQTLSFQAEDFTSSSPSTGQDDDTWTQVADPSASNGFAMQSLDNDGTIYNALPDCCDGVGPEEAALMNFQVNLPTSDDYYIFVYSRRDNGSFSDDSYHIGVNGVRNSTINSIGDEYGWSTDTLTGLSAGANTINIWQREDAVLIDRIVLSTASEITDTATVRIAKSICNCPISDTEIAGTVFEDWNYDGVMNQSDTVGVQGIQVDLFDDCGSVTQSTFTDEGGNYKFSGLSNTTTYRVEFTLPESVSCWAKPTRAGADNGTTVQFVSTGTCASLGIAEPADYCVTNPTIAMPCYLFGAHDDVNANKDALVSFDYNASIDDADSETPGDQAHPVLATYEQIGTVYGVAYDLEGHLYTSAYTKRHADYGPSGQGAIYKIEAGTGTISLFTDLGLPAAGANPHNGNWFNDPDTYDAVGKSGLGDLDIDAEGKNLYTIGLNDRKLYKIPIDGSSTEKFTIPNPCATAANDWRPFGIGMEKGKIYVGGICSAESTGDSIDIGMYIFEFDPMTKTFLNDPVLSFEDFTFNNYPNKGSQWNAWSPNWPFGREQQETGSFYFISFTQPILADIAFDNGDMIIGIKDRFGDQTGTDAGSTDTNDSNLYDGRSNGDILRACLVGNTWMLQQGGRCGDKSTAGVAEDLSGPRDGTGAAGEYYFEDDHVFDAEVSLGALLQISGFPDVAMAAYDPIHVPNSDPLYSPSFYDSGVRWLSNTTGTDERAYRLFDGDDDADGFFGKAAGVGDMGANCMPSPLEIGNYIWEDKDNDGIQDACEPGIIGVNVSLFIKNGSGGCDSLTTIQTDANGQYYFNENTTGLDTLLKDTVYYVVIGESGQWDMATDRLTISGSSYQLSPANQGAKDAIDSDGVEGTGAISCMIGKVFATVQTEGFGCINHTTDFGLYQCDINIKSVTAANCTETAPNVFEAQWSISVEATGLEGETINYRRNNEANATFTPTSGCDTTALTLTGIPADGGLHDTIYVFSTNDNTCADTFIIKRPAPCPISLGSEPGEICATLSSSEIKGTVYEDWNYDGVMNQSDTVGVQGVQINLINECGNSFGTTYTDANGNYRFAGLPEGITYRLAFVLPESVACWAKPTQAGADNGTTVQYVQAGECASLGVASPADYCQDNPLIMTNCYIRGDQSSTRDVLVGVNYNDTGGIQHIALANQIGSTHGLAYQKNTQTLFAAAILKRKAGFGNGKDNTRHTDDDISAIYVIDYSNPSGTGEGTVSAVLDLADYGVDVGQNPRAHSVPANDLHPSNASGHDYDVFQNIAKRGLGDIDISEDGKTLYIVNLNTADPELVILDVSNPTNPVFIQKIDIPNPGCFGGDSFAPWAVKVKKGKVYVGTVCTADVSQSAANLRAYVQVWNGTSFINVDIDGTTTDDFLALDYERTCSYYFINDATCYDADWQYWRNDPTAFPGNTEAYNVPQPILSDIEFGEDGGLILNFMDRLGHQLTGVTPDTSSSGFAFTVSAGDLRYFCNTGTVDVPSYTPEGLGACSQNITPPYNGGNPIPNRHFNTYSVGSDANEGEGHEEIPFGGVGVLLGSGELVFSAMNPEDFHDTGVAFGESHYGAGGLRWLNLESGATQANYTLYDNNVGGTQTFAKINGLGDVEFLCAPAPIEIGNFVWEDIDGNGLQSACEPPIENVILTLYNAACEIVAIDTTDANGQYYFNDTKLAEYVAQSDTAIAANSTYHIVITGANGGAWTTADSTLTIGLNKYSLTSSKQGNDDELDSDGTIGTAASACNSVSDGFVFATVNTADAGCMNHNYDFGFNLQFCPEIALSLSPAEVCAGDSTTLTLDFDSIAGNISIYRHTSLLDSAAINAAGQGGAIFIDSTHTGVVFNEVDYIGGDTIELWNTSCQSINVAHWYVGYKFGYEVLATLTVVSGSLNILAGDKVVLTDFNTINMTNAPGSLVLFSNNNFNDPTGLEDYLQWGAGGQSQEGVAVAKGIWTTGDFIGAIASGNTLQYDGYGNHSDDWFFGASTFGNSNVNTDTPLTTTFNSGALTNGTAAPITYYFYAILTDDNCNKTSNCQPVAIDSIVVNPVPDVTTVDAAICEGLSIDLDTLVTNVNNTTMVDTAYFMTMQEAIDSTNAIVSLVSPTITTEYYVRLSTNSNPSCYDIDNLTITVNNIISSISTTCDDNGTGGDANDDTFTITVTATNASPGASNQYLVMYNGTTLNGSGTTYGMEVTVSHADFVANGSFSPILTIRDADDAGCEEMETVAAVASCSVCPPLICLPVKIKKKGGMN